MLLVAAKKDQCSELAVEYLNSLAMVLLERCQVSLLVEAEVSFLMLLEGVVRCQATCYLSQVLAVAVPRVPLQVMMLGEAILKCPLILVLLEVVEMEHQAAVSLHLPI